MKQLGLFSTTPKNKPPVVERMPSPPVPKVKHDGKVLNGMYFEESTGWHVSYVQGLRYWEGIVKDALPEWKKWIRLERSIADGPREYHGSATRFSDPAGEH